MTSATAGATIFYTISNFPNVVPTHNGATPTGSTAIYSSHVGVAPGSARYFQAVAYQAGMTDSDVTTYDVDNTGQ